MSYRAVWSIVDVLKHKCTVEEWLIDKQAEAFSEFAEEATPDDLPDDDELPQ